MFQGWITQLIDPATDEVAQRWSALMLPVVLATLAVYATRLFRPAAGTNRSAVVDYDRHRLGDRRFSSARLWFSAFAAQTAAAAGIETHIDGDDALDLELIAIQETMIRSTQSIDPDEDLEALEWLTGHFRREVMDEEAESLDRPALSSCWIAFGSLTETGSLLGSRGVAELRLVNAADLGQEAWVTMEWQSRTRRFGRTRRPVAGLVREPDPGLLGDCISRIPLSISPVRSSRGDRSTDHCPDEPGDTALIGLDRRLLNCARSDDVSAPLTDGFIGVAQSARLTICDTWGDHWWTSGSGLELGKRSSATVRCQLFTESDPLPLRRSRVADRDSTGARA